jgi:hypothetical protein
MNVFYFVAVDAMGFLVLIGEKVGFSFNYNLIGRLVYI